MIASKKLTGLILLILLLPVSVKAKESAPFVGVDFKGLTCTGKSKGAGPFDYASADDRRDPNKVPVVEEYHFSPQVELLYSGMSSGADPMGDLLYTILAVPNHHRALLSLIRYQSEVNSKLRPKSTVTSASVECYLLRGMHFSPNDAGVMALYAYYLKENGYMEKAAKIYEKALVVSPDNAKIEYSYALLLIDLKQYGKSVEYARKTYAHSHGRAPKSLKNKLVKLGVWKDIPEKESDDSKIDDKNADEKSADFEKPGVN